MVRMLLLRLWVAFIPIGLYLLWFYLARRRARKNGEPLPLLTDGPWLWTLVASVFTFAFALLIFPLLNSGNEGTHYTPKRLEGNTLIDERFD